MMVTLGVSVSLLVRKGSWTGIVEFGASEEWVAL